MALKMDCRDGNSLHQILDRGYACKYRAAGKSVHLWVIATGRTARHITGLQSRCQPHDAD